MKRILMLLTLLVTILVTLAASGLATQTSHKESLPPGDWSLSYGPAQARGKVVDLFSVSSDAAKGLTVTEVALENCADQDVSAVKIGWKLYEKSNPQTILLTGETPQFLGVALGPGEKRVITFPVVSFAKIYRPLLRGGKLSGSYRIELWVTDVQFDNGNLASERPSNFNIHQAAWKIGAPVKSLLVASRPALKKSDDLGCPERECRWSNSDHCYRCEAASNLTCAWTSCSSCASGRCSGLIE